MGAGILRSANVLCRQKDVYFVFWACWVSYFAAYIGRLNYSAVMVEMIRAEGISNAQAGLVATGFFIAYGAGQLLSGLIGDRIPPKRMVFGGLLVSGLVNLFMAAADTPRQMLVLWTVNGAAQSMTWSPIIRTFAERFPPQFQKKACVNISTTYVCAVLCTYLLSSQIVRLFSWRGMFVCCAVFVLLAAFAWLAAMTISDRFETGAADFQNEPELARPTEAGPRLPLALLVFLGLALVVQGVLRDGIITWVPSYVTQVFQKESSLAILLTAALPVVNLAGVYAIEAVRTKLAFNEIRASFCLFGLSALFVVAQYALGDFSVGLSLAAFGATTSCMLAVNTLLVGIFPTYFVRYRKVSTISGGLNACVYIGSSLATYGIGAIAEKRGWGVLLLTLAAAALLGSLLCAASGRAWVRYAASARKKGSLEGRG